MSERATAVTTWEALFRAQVSVMRQLGAAFPIEGVSLNEYDVLFTLSGQADRRLRLRELNEYLLLTQPSVSRLIDRLASRELVAKLHDPDDARGIVVALTDKGFELFRRRRGRPHALDQREGGHRAHAAGNADTHPAVQQTAARIEPRFVSLTMRG